MGCLLRPIVNTFGSPTYKLAKYWALEDELSHLRHIFAQNGYGTREVQRIILKQRKDKKKGKEEEEEDSIGMAVLPFLWGCY